MVLLTGATGFIGKNFALKLAQRQRIKILVRKTSDVTLFKENKNICVVRGGLEDDLGLAEALTGVSIVVHCAGKIYGKSLDEFLLTNTRGTANLVRAMKEKGINSLLFLSSQSAAGSNQDSNPIDENTQPRPVSWYGLSKKLAEDIIIKSGLNYTILRPCSVYGPYDFEILKIIKLLKYGMFPKFGKGERYINLIYVEDLVNLMAKIVTGDFFKNRLYFVCDGNCYSYSEIIGEIAKILNKSRIIDILIPKAVALFFGTLNDVFLPEKKRIVGRDKIRELIQDIWLCQNSRLCTELGFIPQYSFHEGMRKTIEWYQKNGYL
ncbi:MAG: NAD(P)-dependent oxidoreductase [candidate division WOR-3 bacterium]